LSVFDRGKEIVEKEFRIGWSTRCLRMKLGREEGLCLVADAFVGAVVQVDEQGLPIAAQRVVIHGVSVVLGGDETAFGTNHTYWLIVATVAILEFVG